MTVRGGWRRAACAALAIVVSSAGTAGAQEGGGLDSFTLAFDNDGLAVWTPPSRRSDWFYTHGTRLEAVGGWAPPAAERLGLAELPECAHGAPPGVEGCRLTRVRVQHRIYTPKNLFFYSPFHPPEESDRPYAGWLSAAMSAERVTPERSTAVTLEIGVTGGPSFGQATHEAIHAWLDKAPPRGWEYEIPFEIAGALSYEEARRVPVSEALTLTPRWGATVGTLRTSAGAGLALGIGHNVMAGVGGPVPAGDGFWLQASLGFDGEVVLRDIFLDGSTWHDSARTSKEPLVGRARLRLTFGGEHVGVEIGVTRSTPEFALQAEYHEFATLGLIVRR